MKHKLNSAEYILKLFLTLYNQNGGAYHTISKLEDEHVVKPKDKVDWITKDNRIGKYKLKGRRFILKNEDGF